MADATDPCNAITLIVASMNRTSQLIESLKTWIGTKQITEIIVIDYSSDVAISDEPLFKNWISNEIVTVVRVEGEQYFNLGKAYNVAVDHASNQNILKINCDYKNTNSLWISLIQSCKNKNFFLSGVSYFSENLSGIFYMRKSDFLGYREDLEGWGYHDEDLYERTIDSNPFLKQIVWFDVQMYIDHQPHDDLLRTKNYKIKNKQQSLSINKQQTINFPCIRASRQQYYNSPLGELKFYKNVDRVFCINLKDRVDRWKEFEEINSIKIERFEAIDTRKKPELCNEYGLTVDPISVGYQIYFNRCNGAVGCYLSHYVIWKRIVEESIPYTLITEDDVDVQSIKEFLETDFASYKGYELVQLSEKVGKKNGEVVFNGTESYVISLEGAKKLIEVTHKPWKLNKVAPISPQNIQKFIEKNNIETTNKDCKPYSIVAPADKFITMCCMKDCEENVRLKFFHVPLTFVNPLYKNASDIEPKIPTWLAGEQELKRSLEHENKK
jgi:GR25 family glycosyltransferase involved in LPS biosynthesis